LSLTLSIHQAWDATFGPNLGFLETVNWVTVVGVADKKINNWISLITI
jgi:hypothetical protein